MTLAQRLGPALAACAGLARVTAQRYAARTDFVRVSREIALATLEQAKAHLLADARAA